MEKQCLSTLRLAIPNINPSINLLYSIYQPGLMFRLKTPLVWIDNAKYEASQISLAKRRSKLQYLTSGTCLF